MKFSVAENAANISVKSRVISFRGLSGGVCHVPFDVERHLSPCLTYLSLNDMTVIFDKVYVGNV